MHAVTSRIGRLFFVLAVMVGSSPALADYTFVSIADPATPLFTQVFGVNNPGQVVGDGSAAFIYDSKKVGLTPITPAPGALFSTVLGINAAGVMVGGLSYDGFTESAFVRSKNGVYTVFSHPGCTDTEARAINSTGLVTGFGVECAASDQVGFIYDPARNQFVDFLPGPATIAQGINSSGQVVGSVTLDADAACTGCPAGEYGFLRAASGAISYFRVNGLPTAARGITDSGLITGFVLPGGDADQGFVTTLRGLPFESIAIPASSLLTFPGAFATIPEGITNAGAIVGNWLDASFNNFGFIATPLPPKK